MKIDLHLHTTASDGQYSPQELVDRVIKAGVDTFSFTDHESIEGYIEVVEEATQKGLQLIAGVELLVHYQEQEIHLLGYGMDLTATHFRKELHKLKEERNAVAQAMVAKLQKLGFSLTWDDVKTIAHPRGTISKGHIVHALHRCGLLPCSGMEFIKRYLDPQGLAYVQYGANSFDSAVELIRSSGGVPVIAHPGLIAQQSLLPELLDRHPVGIEVFYAYYGAKRQKWIEHYYEMAKSKKLLMTGGSDYHGSFGPVCIGEVAVPDWVYFELEEAIAKTHHQ
ncbi:PHP domain-containing protein [Heliorestis acidaminivorans]|uniref:PHP domain-containing protein n=1 Tax=Heliorestis acidaminivorans TaxID=553427 RepID=A0A6I0F3J1_9FIRM|nr:PHP domain-containing protein [Heliorestis acidaminivorans]KAB2954310.1 PHP domain-containing protein [Heliorestis acidaminivorans]